MYLCFLYFRHAVSFAIKLRWLDVFAASLESATKLNRELVFSTRSKFVLGHGDRVVDNDGVIRVDFFDASFWIKDGVAFDAVIFVQFGLTSTNGDERENDQKDSLHDGR